MSDISIDQNNQAREAERAVLGGLMLETHRFDTVIQVITETDFQGKDHQIIFESMSELVNENKPLDPLTVSEKLDNSNNLNRVGGKNYLIELATSTPSAANLEAYAEIIRQRSISRKLMQANSEITDLINNPQPDHACIDSFGLYRISCTDLSGCESRIAISNIGRGRSFVDDLTSKEEQVLVE
jgi:replicative DNA helicase